MNLSGESKGFFSNLDLSYVSLISEVIAASLQNASMHREQKRLAITDGLTGLTNRRRFQELLQHNFARARPVYKLRLSCILCDIDHFKNVNDDHGHLAGDAILQEVAVRMKRHLREVDTLAQVWRRRVCDVASGDRPGRSENCGGAYSRRYGRFEVCFLLVALQTSQSLLGFATTARKRP